MAIITNINMGRVLTSAEAAARSTSLTNAIAAGTVYGYSNVGNSVSSATSANYGPEIIIWSTTDAGNAYVTGANAFNPPPVSAAVQTI